MNIMYRPTRYLISGISGYGKSTMVERLVKLLDMDKTFIFDHQEEFAGRFNLPESDIEGLGNAILARKCKIICFNPRMDFGASLQQAYDWFARYVYDYSWINKEEKCFVCDEQQDFINSYSSEEGLNLILQNSRKQQLNSILACQQENMIHNIARSQVTHRVYFHQEDITAAKHALSKGISMEELQGLGIGQYIMLNNGKREDGNLFKKVVDSNLEVRQSKSLVKGESENLPVEESEELEGD